MKKSKKILVVLIVLVILVIISLVVYKFLSGNQKEVEVKTIKEISEYGYALKENETQIYKD